MNDEVTGSTSLKESAVSRRLFWRVGWVNGKRAARRVGTPAPPFAGEQDRTLRIGELMKPQPERRCAFGSPLNRDIRDVGSFRSPQAAQRGELLEPFRGHGSFGHRDDDRVGMNPKHVRGLTRRGHRDDIDSGAGQ